MIVSDLFDVGRDHLDIYFIFFRRFPQSNDSFG